MKLILKHICIGISVLLMACEDVVEVNLPNANPKLVIDASIDWKKGTEGNYQSIKLTTTTDFYSTEVPVVRGANISISNSNGIIFEFIESDSGLYECFNFAPQINEQYTLTIELNGTVYTATDRLSAVPDIAYVEQFENGGFGGDSYEINFYYQDDATNVNYYLSKFDVPNEVIPDWSVSEDRFFQGNMMRDILISDELHPNDTIEYTLYSIGEQYYNYMFILLQQSGGGNPFQTVTSSLRGNIINQTEPDNFPLGYFRTTQYVKQSYTIN